MLNYGMKCTHCGFSNIFWYLSENAMHNWEKWCWFLSGKDTALNNSRKDRTFGIDLVGAMCYTHQTISLANASQLLIYTWKHYHTRWSPNMLEWFMYESIEKYVIQGLECVKQGINPSCAKFHIFPQFIEGVHFPEISKYTFS